jgi:hypothetical protein
MASRPGTAAEANTSTSGTPNEYTQLLFDSSSASNNGDNIQRKTFKKNDKRVTIAATSFSSSDNDDPPPPPAKNGMTTATTTKTQKRKGAEFLGSLDFERVVNEYSIQAMRDLYQIVDSQTEDDDDEDDIANRRHRRRHVQTPEKRFMNSRGITRWFLTIACSLLSGLTTVMVVASTEKLVAWRTASMNYLLKSHYKQWLVFAWYAFVSMVLADAAAAMCVYWAPEAAGSGIPEVKAYLNGIRVKKFNQKRMLFVKMVGSVLSVVSSMAVGMEGPLVCIGGAFAA